MARLAGPTVWTVTSTTIQEVPMRYDKLMPSDVNEDRAQKLSRGAGAQIHLAREIIDLRDALDDMQRDHSRERGALQEELHVIRDDRGRHQQESQRLHAALNAAHKKDRLHREHRDHLTRVLVSLGKELTMADDSIMFPEMGVEG